MQKSRKHSQKYKRKNGRIPHLAGYMTVEATLIMPIVLYLCIFMMYSGFFLYDKCVMKQDAFRAVLKGSSIYGQDNAEAYNAAWEQMNTITAKKYIAADCQYEVQVQDKVSVSISGYIDMPFWGLANLTKSSGWEIAETVESKCLNPTLFVRMCRQLTEAGEALAEENTGW